MFIHNSVFLEHHCCFSKFTAQLDVTEYRLEKKDCHCFSDLWKTSLHFKIETVFSCSLAYYMLYCRSVGLFPQWSEAQKFAYTLNKCQAVCCEGMSSKRVCLGQLTTSVYRKNLVPWCEVSSGAGLVLVGDRPCWPSCSAQQSWQGACGSRVVAMPRGRWRGLCRLLPVAEGLPADALSAYSYAKSLL